MITSSNKMKMKNYSKSSVVPEVKDWLVKHLWISFSWNVISLISNLWQAQLHSVQQCSFGKNQEIAIFYFLDLAKSRRDNTPDTRITRFSMTIQVYLETITFHICCTHICRLPLLWWKYWLYEALQDISCHMQPTIYTVSPSRHGFTFHLEKFLTHDISSNMGGYCTPWGFIQRLGLYELSFVPNS